MCETGDRFLTHNAPSHNATTVKQFFGPTKSDCARPPSVFARFSTCWLLFVPKSEISLEGAHLWLDFRHPGSLDKHTKHHCKRRLLQRHPEAVWPCKSVCTVTRGLRRKLNNKNVSVDKKNQLDVTFCILYFSSNSCSTCFGQPCAHHQQLNTAWCYSLVLVCAVAAGRWSSPVGR